MTFDLRAVVPPTWRHCWFTDGHQVAVGFRGDRALIAFCRSRCDFLSLSMDRSDWWRGRFGHGDSPRRYFLSMVVRVMTPSKNIGHFYLDDEADFARFQETIDEFEVRRPPAAP